MTDTDPPAWGQARPDSLLVHAYPAPQNDEWRRSMQPRALCGNAWAPKWPVAPPDPGKTRCRTCERVLDARALA